MPLSKEEMSKAVEKGIENWMDKQFQTFGRWSFYTFGSIVLVSITYFAMRMMGWHKG